MLVCLFQFPLKERNPFTDKLMRAQKEELDRLLTEFYEPCSNQADHRVSILVSTLQREGCNQVETISFIAEGILKPDKDIAPFHEDFSCSHGWIATLRWFHSAKLAKSLENHWQPYKGKDNWHHPTGILNVSNCQIEKHKEHSISFNEDPSGIFRMKLLSHPDETVYKLVHSSEVRRLNP